MGKRDREILENVRIETVAAEGNALAHVNGKALFVPMAVPGDVVNVQVTHKKRNYMEGYILEMVEPSHARGPVLQPLWRLRRLPLATHTL